MDHRRPIFDQGPHIPTDFIGEPNKGELTVAVPDSLFKIVVRTIDDEPGFETLAFIYSQDEPQAKRYDHIARLTSIDAIEAASGLDFLTVLPDDIETRIESVVATEIWS